MSCRQFKTKPLRKWKSFSLHEQSFMYETYMGWSVGQVGKQKRVDKLLRFHAPFHTKRTDSANSLRTT